MPWIFTYFKVCGLFYILIVHLQSTICSLSEHVKIKIFNLIEY